MGIPCFARCISIQGAVDGEPIGETSISILGGRAGNAGNRCPCVRHNRPGHARPHHAGGRDVRLGRVFHHGRSADDVCGHAVPLCTTSGGLERPLRATPYPAAVACRHMRQLSAAGLGAIIGVAVHWPGNFRRDGGERVLGQCLHCRRNGAGRTGASLRPGRRNVCAWLRARSGDRRCPRRLRTSPAICRRGRACRGQCLVWAGGAVGEPSARSPPTLPLAIGRSDQKSCAQ